MSTAITVAGQRSPLPLVPTDAGELWRMSEQLAKSSIIPDALRGKPSDVFVVLMTGAELRISPMQALRQMNVIGGKVVMSAELLAGLCLRERDICAYFQVVSTDDAKAVYETQRKGTPKPTTMAYTMAQAIQAGNAGKDNYKKGPAAMLRARCAAALARAVYPDLTQGLYVPEELEEVPGTATLVQAPRSLADLTARLDKYKDVTPHAVHVIEPPSIQADEAAEIAAAEREVGSDG